MPGLELAKKETLQRVLIGSGGHRIIVRRMLEQIARAAERDIGSS